MIAYHSTVCLPLHIMPTEAHPAYPCSTCTPWPVIAHVQFTQHMGCYMATRPRRASWKRLKPLCMGHKLQTAEMAIKPFDI